MGASEWKYFVPYQPDIKRAFHELREQLFRQGKYWLRTPWWKTMSLEAWLDPAEVGDIDEDERAEYEAEYHRLQTLPEPRTIAELIEWNGEEGTSSILDMQDVSEIPQLFTVSPLTDEQLRTVFGTTQPARAMLAQVDGAYHELRESWSGIYIILYQDGSAHEIFFTGFSGD